MTFSGSARAAGRQVAGGLHGELIVTVGPVGVGDVEPHHGRVAGRQEARQAGGDHHRIAHDHIRRGMADRFVRPGDRHDAHGAVELRDVEIDRRLAVGVELHRAGEEGDELFRRRLALGRHARAVAAGAQLAGDAERSVDQAAVEVAEFEAEAALAVIPLLRIGHLVVGQVEDADIDRSDGHIGVGPGWHAGDADGDRQRLVRLGLCDRRKRYRQLARTRIDLQPFEADGAGRHARFLRLARTEQGGGHIGAGAPFGRNRNFDGRRRLRGTLAVNV